MFGSVVFPAMRVGCWNRVIAGCAVLIAASGCGGSGGGGGSSHSAGAPAASSPAGPSATGSSAPVDRSPSGSPSGSTPAVPSGATGCAAVGLTPAQVSRISGLTVTSRKAKGLGCAYTGSIDAMGRGDTVAIQRLTSSAGRTRSVFGSFDRLGRSCRWGDRRKTRFSCTNDAGARTGVYAGVVVVAGGAHSWEATVNTTAAARRDAADTGLTDYLSQHGA